MIFRYLLAFCWLHFWSVTRIVTRLEMLLGIGALRFRPTFSGRSALFILAAQWRPNVSCRVALVPDYICNVVHVALEKAGYEISTYRTDDMFEPDADEIRLRVMSGEVGLLVTASVFGSSALLQELAGGAWREAIIRHNVHVIVDLCQDISLIRELPAGYGEHLAAVLSFNDKSFPGAMGGGILAERHNDKETERLSLWRRAWLYRMLLVKSLVWWANAMKIRRRKAAFEYSYCRVFPYTCDCFEPTKLQLIMALIGLANLARLHARKERFALSCPWAQRTRYFRTAPYLACALPSNGEVLPGRRRKGSYAMHGSPDTSLRPDLLILHNKGFFDA